MQHYLEHARETLSAFERLIEKAQEVEHEELAIATRCIVRLRDAMVADRRQGDDWNGRQQETLDRVNSMLSVAISAEFPLVGVRWERLCMLRDALRELIGDWEKMPPSPRKEKAPSLQSDGASR
jgi:hypothetical protein